MLRYMTVNLFYGGSILWTYVKAQIGFDITLLFFLARTSSAFYITKGWRPRRCMPADIEAYGMPHYSRTAQSLVSQLLELRFRNLGNLSLKQLQSFKGDIICISHWTSTHHTTTPGAKITVSTSPVLHSFHGYLRQQNLSM